jgi:hypothetical protein
MQLLLMDNVIQLNCLIQIDIHITLNKREKGFKELFLMFKTFYFNLF